MDYLTFTVETLKAVAWPTATLVIAVVYRKQISDLLGRVKKGKVGPAEFEFEQRVAQLQADAALTLAPSGTQFGTPTAIAHPPSEPRSAILEAWLQVEAAASELGNKRLKLEPALGRSPLLVLRKATHDKLIEPQHLALFNDLRVLRNQAAHDSDFSPSLEAVRDFGSLAGDLAQVLRTVANDA